MGRKQLPFERLDVYQAALDFAVLVHRMTQRVPRGNRSLVDQLRRASTSVVTNTAEAASEFAKAEKARIFRIALRSVGECFGVLALMERLGFASEHATSEIRDVGDRVFAMLTRLAKRLPDDPPMEPPPSRSRSR